MADIVPPKSSGRSKKSRPGKHFAPRATAEQISRGLGVTARDAQLVRKVLTELGYINKDTKAKRSEGSSAKASKGNQ